VVVQAQIADADGLQVSFLLTAVCELHVLFYAPWGCKLAGGAQEPGQSQRRGLNRLRHARNTVACSAQAWPSRLTAFR
jgi:hypothetical protein